MWQNFFKFIDIDPANVHILDGNAPDLQAECHLYEKKIREAGGIELFMGGKFVYALWLKRGITVQIITSLASFKFI